jgi:lysylphosphatidylglycerol synthetase-like protein (DUF2156 family)
MAYHKLSSYLKSCQECCLFPISIHCLDNASIFQRKILRLGISLVPSLLSTAICTLTHSHIVHFLSSYNTRYSYLPNSMPLFLQQVTLPTYLPSYEVKEETF